VLGHAIDVTDRIAVEQRLRQNIEQRDMLSFLADFSDRLSPQSWISPRLHPQAMF